MWFFQEDRKGQSTLDVIITIFFLCLQISGYLLLMLISVMAMASHYMFCFPRWQIFLGRSCQFSCLQAFHRSFGVELFFHICRNGCWTGFSPCHSLILQEFPGMSRSAKALGLFSQASCICDLWVVGLLIFLLDFFLSRLPTKNVKGSIPCMIVFTGIFGKCVWSIRPTIMMTFV